MSFLEPDASQNQTEWKFGTWTFYANIPEEIKDLKIVENAKSIVDFAIPQRFGPHGTHYYSFVTREYVLNLILYFYKEHKRFPHGDICILDHWYWKSIYSGGRVFQSRKEGRNYTQGDWIYLPSLREVKKSKRIINEN
jgi:hypothetical protein